MPKKNIDYSKTIIYKIVCKDVNIKDFYIGSTTNFTNRKRQHKNIAINDTVKSHYYVYVFINQNGGWDNFDMIEVEKYNASDHNDALKRERYWLEELNATLNAKIPSRDKEEYRKKWRKDNPEKNKEQIKRDSEKFKEKITCVCGCVLTKYHIPRHEKTTKHLNFLN